MKTNLQMLRQLIREEEDYLEILRFTTQEYIYNELNEELDGTSTILKDNKEKLNEKIKQTEDLTKQLLSHKKLLLEKENKLRLNDGRTTKQATIDNKYKLKLKYYYENLLRKDSKKVRMNDSKSVYFLEYKTNVDKKKIKEKIKDIEDDISNTTNEILKLNTTDFKID